MIEFEKKMKSRTVPTYINEGLIVYVEMLAAKHDRTVSNVIAKIIEKSKEDYDAEQEEIKNGT